MTAPVDRESLRKLSGLHSEHGILVACGSSIKRGFSLQRIPNIIDLAPTFLFSMGVPVPQKMEGEPILDLFDPAVLHNGIVETSDWEGRQGVQFKYESSEVEDIKSQLEGLGYL